MANFTNESYIRDIVDLLNDVKDVTANAIPRKKNSWTSIARASSNLTMVFPVIASRNISIENASMITKAIERKAVTMLQMLFAANQVSDAQNLQNYVDYFHKNIDFNKVLPGIDDVIGFSDDMFAMKNNINFESAELSDLEMKKMLMEDMKDRGIVLGDDICESSINDYRLRKTMYGTSVVLEKKIDDAYSKYDINQLERERDSYKNKYEKLSSDREIEKGARDAQKLAADIGKNKNEFLSRQVLDSDIKKANELIPSMMIVNFLTKSPNGELTKVDQGVIGVKAKLFPASSSDITNRIRIKNEDRQGLVKFIRATTKEIAFWKDFVFAIDNAKIDAITSAKRGSSNKFWKVLERRAVKSKRRRLAGNANDAAAITTLAISQEEVEYLKKEHQIDLEQLPIAYNIMDSYNLMCIVIVDEANEVAKFIFDTNDDAYENISFRNLEREASDGSYKKIVNLMTKVAR